MSMYKFFVSGLVQGVGFRPYILNACRKNKLQGYVMNTGTGVLIVANQKKAVLNILKTPPPLARIDNCTISTTDEDCDDFVIRDSLGEGFAEIPSDLFLCDDCLLELLDKNNRRNNYFFITCTNCGPRFTMTKRSPYDRHTTTMNDFTMCAECKNEYRDPTNRRYHAQTIACHSCGPTMRLYRNAELQCGGTGNEIVTRAMNVLQGGDVLAIKGVGGFHLTCTTHPSVVQKLTSLTKRPNKPLALLCKDMQMIESIANVSTKEKEMLQSVERPIVVLEKKVDLSHISELSTVGVMLPSTALHHLLFLHIDEPLVLTSSNLSGEPITLEREQQFVPWVLDHTRTIETSVDDSLIKVIQEQSFHIRRSRGYVPRSIQTKYTNSADMLACGAEMNSTFALFKDGKVTPSQYLGNTSNPEVLAHYKNTLKKFIAFTDTHPTLVCTDLHPDFHTTLLGRAIAEEWGAQVIPIQHHKAHAYSIALEHGVDDFTAIICDGFGYGDDGTIWGGEIFHNSERIGHLEQHLQLGGDSATVLPVKMAYAILRKFLTPEETACILGTKCTEKEYAMLNTQWKHKLNTPLTTSCGRVLDAVASLLGICQKRTYEGRPAMLLESFGTKPYDIKPVLQGNVLMTTPLFEFLVQNIHKDRGRLAATAEMYLAQGLFTIASGFNRPILFGGGCAYNKRMTSYMLERGVLTNKQIPAGDGGISVGQIGFVLANPGYDIA